MTTNRVGIMFINNLATTKPTLNPVPSWLWNVVIQDNDGIQRSYQRSRVLDRQSYAKVLLSGIAGNPEKEDIDFIILVY